MKIKDLQIEDEYFVIDHDKPVLDLARMITETGIPDAVVMKDGKPVGVVDDFDIVSKLVAENKDPTSTPVSEIMHAPPYVNPETDIERLRQIFDEMDPSIVPVIDNEGQLLGVATLFDVLSAEKKPRFKLFGGK